MSKQNLRAWAVLAVTAALFAMMGQRCIIRPTPLEVDVTVAPTTGTGSTAVTLTAEATGGSGTYTYAWTASPSTTITNADAASASATVGVTTTFTCTVTDSDGDTASDTGTVTVSGPAVSVVANAPSAAEGGDTVNLNAVVTDGVAPLSFTWLVTAFGTEGGVTLVGNTSQTPVATFSDDAAGTFSFQVTVTAANGTASDSVDVVVTPGGATDFTILTDDLLGTADDDVFDGRMYFNAPTGTFQSTVQSADQADGLDGDDSADIEIEAGAAAVTVTPSIANIETLNITAVDSDSNAGNDTDVTFDASKTTGVTAVSLTNVVTDADDNQAGELRIINLEAIPTLSIVDTTKPVSVAFDADAVEDAADAMTINLEGVSDGRVTNETGGIESYTINSGGSAANTIESLVTTGDAETLTITGDQDLDLGTAIENTFEAVDASALTGDLTIIMADAAGNDMTLTTGSGDDTVTGLVAGDTVTADLGAGDDSITIAGFTDGTDSLEGGDGSDTVLLTSAVATAIADDIDDIVNFEILGVSDALAGNLNATYIDGVTGVTLAAGVNGDRTITVLAASTVTFEADSATADDDVTIAVNTNGTGVAGENITIELADTVDADGTISGDLILNGFETATINVTEQAQQVDDALQLNDDVAGAGATTTITITGDENFDAGTITADVTNAAAFTGNLTATLAGTSTITGGSGDDTLTGSAAADTIAGGEGDDTIDGAAGADSINGGAGDDTITGGMGNDSITLGDGADTFIIWDDTDDAAYTGGVETVADFATGEDLIQIDDSAVTTNGGVGAVAEAAYYEGAATGMTAGTAYDIVVLTGTGYANVGAAEDAVAAASTSATAAAVIFFDTTSDMVRMYWDADIDADDGLDNTATMAIFSDITDVADIGAAFAYTDFEIIA